MSGVRLSFSPPAVGAFRARSGVSRSLRCLDDKRAQPPALKESGTGAELQAGGLANPSRTDASFMAAIGAMVIGILPIIGAARSFR
jgi:hypothetical protein